MRLATNLPTTTQTELTSSWRVLSDKEPNGVGVSADFSRLLSQEIASSDAGKESAAQVGLELQPVEGGLACRENNTETKKQEEAGPNSLTPPTGSVENVDLSSALPLFDLGPAKEANVGRVAASCSPKNLSDCGTTHKSAITKESWKAGAHASSTSAKRESHAPASEKPAVAKFSDSTILPLGQQPSVDASPIRQIPEIVLASSPLTSQSEGATTPPGLIDLTKKAPSSGSSPILPAPEELGPDTSRGARRDEYASVVVVAADVKEGDATHYALPADSRALMVKDLPSLDRSTLLSSADHAQSSQVPSKSPEGRMVTPTSSPVPTVSTKSDLTPTKQPTPEFTHNEEVRKSKSPSSISIPGGVKERLLTSAPQTETAPTPQFKPAANDRSSIPAPPRDIAANPYTLMDNLPSGSSGQVLHASHNEVAVGVHDPTYGWVEIKTHLNAGQLSASVSTAPGEASREMQNQLPAMAEYLADRHIHLDSLSLDGFSSSPSDSGAGNAAQGGRDNDQPHNPMTDGPVVSHRRASVHDVAPILRGGPHRSSRVDVMA